MKRALKCKSSFYKLTPQLQKKIRKVSGYEYSRIIHSLGVYYVIKDTRRITGKWYRIALVEGDRVHLEELNGESLEVMTLTLDEMASRTLFRYIALVGQRLPKRSSLKNFEIPLKFADSLVCLFLPKDQALILLGDLIEDYKTLRKDRGNLVAKVWYWRQALSAVLPALRRWGIKIATLCGFEEFVRHYLR